MAGSVTDFSALRSALSHRDYAVYTAGNTVSLIGYWMQKLAVGWLAWELTRSEFWLGIVAFADLVPTLLLSPFGGVLADRFDKKRIIVLSQIVLTAQATTLALLVAFDALDLTRLLAVAFVMGVSFAAQEASRSAILHELVPKDDVPTAAALGAVIFNAARFIGPAVAGVVISNVNVAWAIAAHAIAALIMILTLLTLSRPRAIPVDHPQGLGVLGQLKEGVSVAVTHRIIAPMLLVMLATTLFVRPIYELMPGIVDELLGQGVGGLSAAMSAIGMGAVVAGLLIAKRGATQHFFRLALVGAALTATALLLFLVVDIFWLALVILFALGFFMSTCSTSTQIVVQTTASDAYRGRLLSLWGIIIRGGPAIGAPLVGWIAVHTGFRWPLIVSGILCLLVIAFIFRERRDIALSPQTEPQDTEPAP